MSISDKVMLIIGIDTYENKDIEPLPSCKKDAEDISTFFAKKGFVNYEESLESPIMVPKSRKKKLLSNDCSPEIFLFQVQQKLKRISKILFIKQNNKPR